MKGWGGYRSIDPLNEEQPCNQIDGLRMVIAYS